MRTTLADRPGALAALTARCGAEGVNILALQIFPAAGALVTDELVLSAPEEWGMADVAAMVEGAGGSDVHVSTCTAHALVDGPTNYLLALRHVIDEPAAATEALTELLDGEEGHDFDPFLSVLEVPVGGTTVTVRRGAPFTVTEEARAGAFAALLDDVLAVTQNVGGTVGLRPLGPSPV